MYHSAVFNRRLANVSANVLERCSRVLGFGNPPQGQEEESGKGLLSRHLTGIYQSGEAPRGTLALRVRPPAWVLPAQACVHVSSSAGSLPTDWETRGSPRLLREGSVSFMQQPSSRQETQCAFFIEE